MSPNEDAESRLAGGAPHNVAQEESSSLMRYVAFLRGVSPLNASMSALKLCFESAGFFDVRTILSSGNVAFDARASSPDVLERHAEKAMRAELGRSFATIVRPARCLQDLIESDPFAQFKLPPKAKRVITFLRRPRESVLALLIERDGARILKLVGTEAFTAYVPGEKGPVFMSLLERTFGTDITTRTVDTVRKCASA
jgi:uncharacterized protein (DUF1697 family)